MYEEIKRYLSELFSREPSIEEVLRQKHTLLMKQILESKTLAELFNSRAQLIEYNEEVKKIGSPTWAKNNVKFLEAKWNLRYRIWKTRG